VLSARPGLIIRLTNFIVVQVLFIFVAILLILFSPDNQELAGRRLKSFEENLARTGAAVSAILNECERSDTTAAAARGLTELFRRSSFIERAAVVRLLDGERVQTAFCYPDDSDRSKGAASMLGSEVIDLMVRRGEIGVSWSVLHADRLVHFQRLSDSTSPAPTFLVSTVDHGLIVSSRSGLIYAVFVLFLCSTLISLLMVSLVLKRFKLPLERLIRGLEKTSTGKLYHLVEPENDRELGKLAAAYNRMVESLWGTHRQLRSSNALLRRSNYSMFESQLFLAAVIDNCPLSVVVANAAGPIMILNRAASKVFGYAPEEVVGGQVSKLIAEGVGQTCPVEETADGAGYEAICRRSSGELFPAYVVAGAIPSQDQAHRATLYMCRDISESKRFQDMMIRLDRYYTRGEMAGDIAHEINNYLAVLMGNLELLPLLLKKGNSEKIDRKMTIMRETVDKIARFANGLMDVPQDETRLEISSLNQLVKNVVVFLKPQNRFDGIEFSTDLAAGIPLIMVDQGQIQQLLVNLIYNAADALKAVEGKKRIEIVTGSEVRGVERLALLEVRDNGAGVAADKVELLFRERFTTKRKGHGIGLITCRRIVENHGGDICYRSGDGAVFVVSLPARRESPVEIEQTVAVSC